MFWNPYESKYGAGAPRKLSESSAAHTRSNYKKLASVKDRRMDEVTIDEWQELINSICLCRTVVEQTLFLIRQLYRYAVSRGYCTQNPAQYVRLPDTRPQTHHQDFTDQELAKLWANREDPVVRMVLIFCYSGFRLSAFETMEIDLEQYLFRGGVKTAAGRARVVPIHSLIQPFVRELVHSGKAYLCSRSRTQFYIQMKKKMKEIGIDSGQRHHTPHSCRHTFSRLCESYGVREADRKRLMGHSFGNDITNGVYGHRSVEELRTEIEKIKAGKS